MKAKNVVKAGVSLLKCVGIKMFCCNNFNFKPKNLLFPAVHFDFGKRSTVITGENFSCRRNVQIQVMNGAKLRIGDNVFLNSNSIINCHEDIEIGDNSKFGPSTYIYDNDHVLVDGIITSDYKTSKIQIGSNCWFGANCLILRGTVVGDGCIFGGGSVVKGNYAPGTFVIQRRDTVIKNLVDCSCAIEE